MKLLHKIAKEVETTGVVSRLFRQAEGLYIGEPAKGFTWGALAREFALRLPGLFIVGQSGISWINGAGGSKMRIVPLPHWVDMEPGRDAIRSLLGGGINPLSTATAGRAAKLLLRYACDPQPYRAAHEIPMRDLPMGYIKVDPGMYPRCQQFDASGFYYQILRRLKSPHVRPHESGLHWYGLNEFQRGTWNDTISAVQDAKLLRNALVGSMMGSTIPHYGFCKDKERGGIKRIEIPPSKGPLRAAGLTIVRTGYEICQAESLLSGSIYSIIDCVTLPSERTPALWPSLGLTYRLRRSGGSIISCRGSYRIGEYKTHLYRIGFRENKQEASPQFKGFSYAAHWFLRGQEELSLWPINFDSV